MIDWKSIELFAELDDSQLESLASIFSPFHVEAGEYLMREGDPGEEMYILVSGRVRITKSMLHSDVILPLLEMENPRKVLANLDGKSHPVLGELALLDSDVRSANVECLESSDFLFTNRQRFFQLITSDPVLGCSLLTILGRRLAHTIRNNNMELLKMTTALALALSKS